MAACTSTASTSAPDAANGIDGIPALTNREVETGVEIRSGQTLAIAGLLQRTAKPAITVSRGSARCRTWGGLPLGQPPDQRGRDDRAGHPGNRRRHGARPGADLLPGWTPPIPPTGSCSSKVRWRFPIAARATGRGPHLNGGRQRRYLPGGSPTNPQDPQNPTTANQVAMNPPPAEPGFIGPIGYDVLK